MGNAPDDERLKQLDARIAQVKKSVAPKPRVDEHYSQANVGWRMVTELVAGLGIGFGIGFGLDVLLGTKPWLMMLFMMLGFAAGVRVMFRSAQELSKNTAAGSPAEDERE